MHCVPASPQDVPFATLFARQVPAASHVSGAVHASFVALPQAVPAAFRPLSTHAPDWQVSGTRQSTPASAQTVPFAASFG